MTQKKIGHFKSLLFLKIRPKLTEKKNGRNVHTHNGQ